jgi:hypothetical protein
MPKYDKSLDGVERTLLTAEVRLTREEYDKLERLAQQQGDTLKGYLSTILMNWVDKGLKPLPSEK